MGQIGSLNTFSAGTTIASSPMNSNFNTIKTTYNAHDSATTGVHGVTGSIVGTSDSQTLSNKTLTTPAITTSATITATSADALLSIFSSGGSGRNWRLVSDTNGDLIVRDVTGSSDWIQIDQSADTIVFKRASANSILQLSSVGGSGKAWGLNSRTSGVLRLSDDSTSTTWIDFDAGTGYAEYKKGIRVTATSAIADILISSSGGSGKQFTLQSRTDGTFRVADDTAGTARFDIDTNGRATFYGEVLLPNTDPPTAGYMVRKSGLKNSIDFTVTGASAATINEDFNVSSTSVSNYDLVVTLDTDYANTNYTLVGSVQTANPFLITFQNKNTGSYQAVAINSTTGSELTGGWYGSIHSAGVQ